MNERVRDQVSTMGTDLPVENVSAEDADPLQVKRSAPQRDPLGRFSSMPLPHRKARPADGYGGVETVTGAFMPDVRNHALLRHPDRATPLPVTPDYSYMVSEARKSHAGFHAAQDDLNHRLSCPTCTVMGC
jgi:hypothetical protein